MNNKEIGLFIKEQREKLGLSWYMLAKEAKLSNATTIKRCESGDGGVRLDVLRKLLNALKCDMSLFVKSEEK
jgi:ribosome-binding protein aMBF1 (putative translation factor)